MRQKQIVDPILQLERPRYSKLLAQFIRTMAKNGDVREGMDLLGMIDLAQRFEADDGTINGHHFYTHKEGQWIRNLAYVVDDIAFAIFTQNIRLKREWWPKPPHTPRRGKVNLKHPKGYKRRFVSLWANKVTYLDKVKEMTHHYVWRRKKYAFTRVDCVKACMLAYIEGAVML